MPWDWETINEITKAAVSHARHAGRRTRETKVRKIENENEAKCGRMSAMKTRSWGHGRRFSEGFVKHNSDQLAKTSSKCDITRKPVFN